MNRVELLGFVAGFIMIFAFLPQLVRTFKTKRTNDLSIFMLILQMTCIALWTIYGIFIFSLSLIVSNAISFLIVLAVFIMKLLYDKRNTNVN